MDREIRDARKNYNKALTEFNDSSSQLSSLKQRVERAQSDMNSARDSMVGLNQAAQTMDLIGAQDVKPEREGYSYFINGDRHHADTSNFQDIILTKWKDHVAENNKSKENNAVIDSTDIPRDFIEEMKDILSNSALEGISNDEDSGDTMDKMDKMNFYPYNKAEDTISNKEHFLKLSHVESSVITKVAKRTI